MRLEQLSYANPDHPPFKRWLIRSIESMSGRDAIFRLYETWRTDVVPQGAAGVLQHARSCRHPPRHPFAMAAAQRARTVLW
jgi:hypothetical protein